MKQQVSPAVVAVIIVVVLVVVGFIGFKVLGAGKPSTDINDTAMREKYMGKGAQPGTTAGSSMANPTPPAGASRGPGGMMMPPGPGGSGGMSGGR